MGYLSISVTQTDSLQALVPSCSSPIKADSSSSSSILTELQTPSSNSYATSPSNTFTYLQTHGFFPDRFFRGGYSDTANAGRALASRGIVVLQVEEPYPDVENPWRELPKSGIDAYLAAIDKLDNFVDFSDPEVLKQLKEKIQAPAEADNFSDYTHQPEFKEDFDDKAILEYALGREDSAMKQYQELADNSPEGPLKSVFQFLAYEETQHKKELEMKYKELIG